MEQNAVKLRHMPVSERLKLLEEVWSSLIEHPEQIGVPDWHRDELDRRVAAHGDNPSAARPWDEIKAELRIDSRK